VVELSISLSLYSRKKGKDPMKPIFEKEDPKISKSEPQSSLSKKSIRPLIKKKKDPQD